MLKQIPLYDLKEVTEMTSFSKKELDKRTESMKRSWQGSEEKD